MNGVIVFEANEGIHGQELWRSDGTEAGTWLVKDIRPGPEPSLPNDFRQVDGELAFIAMGDEAGHHQRWRTDGTPEGTVIVEEGIGDGFSSLQGRSVTAGGVEFFLASEWVYGMELWKVTKRGGSPRWRSWRPWPRSPGVAMRRRLLRRRTSS